MNGTIGIDIGGHGIKGAVVDPAGRILDRGRVALSPEQRAIEAVEGALAGLVRDLDPSGSLPVGVGVPGFFDERAGLLRGSPNFPGWEDQPVPARLEALLGVPVVTGNDANCAVLGEAWVGAAAGAEGVVMLTLGTGVGSGLLVHGRLVTGVRGAAGEGGHLPLHPGGRRCGCGRLGCLEAYASGPGLLRTGVEEHARDGEGPAPARAEDVFAGDAAWQVRARARFVADLAQGLVPIVHLLSPEVVVIGGGVAGAWGRFAPALRKELQERAIPACWSGARLVPAALGSDAGALGAARLAQTVGPFG